jgi:hypothetical protein
VKTPGGFEPDLHDLADDTCEALVAKSLLHDGQDIRVPEGLSVDDTIRVKSGRRDARREEISRMHAPQHRPFETGENTCHEESGHGGIFVSQTRFRDLMQSAKSEPAARETAIDLADPEWQVAKAAASFPEPVKVLAQSKKNRVMPGINHALRKAPRQVCSYFVLDRLASQIAALSRRFAPLPPRLRALLLVEGAGGAHET